jgi:hypothetical protein
MAPAKVKKTPQRPAPATARKRAGTPTQSDEVERQWGTYWACRKRLEEMVEKVRAAGEALRNAQEQEKACRAEFDDIKRSLTKLLEVDPAGAAAREPIPLQRNLAEAAPKQAG